VSSETIHKRHNVNVLLYHLVCPCKYRQAVVTSEVDDELRTICLEIALRFEITFLEIGTDCDHVHFLIQSVPDYSPSKIAQTVKSITAREIFRRVPSVKTQLWSGAFWTSGYYINSVSRHGSEKTISIYVANQGRAIEYKSLHIQQLELF
jgi:putative transposase